MNIQKRLEEKFGERIKCIIIYGSWAKGTAREDSDIDLLILFDEVNVGTGKTVYEIEKETESNTKKCITLVPVSVNDFRKEKIPLFTAVKQHGRIVWGYVDLTINPQTPDVKYAEYLGKSKELETKKVEMVEEILKRHPDYSTANLCFIASKHAIQMALPMKGKGYSSKIAVLLPPAKE